MMQTDPQTDSMFLARIEDRLRKMKMTANWVSGALIAMGFLAIASSLFVSAFMGQVNDLIIRILAFASTLSITLIGAFNLSLKASDTRNGWKYLNKAVIAYKANLIDAEALLKAYEDSENFLGMIDFNYTKDTAPKNNAKGSEAGK